MNLNHDKNVVSDNFVELIEFYNIIKEYKQECIDYINNVALEYNGIDKSPLTKEEFGELGKKYPLYKDYIVDEYDYKYSIQYRNRMKHEDSNTIHFVAINYEKNLEK